MMRLPKVIVYQRNPECEMCGSEMNPGHEYYYRGCEICPRCHEELEGIK